jgi:hypothetical protein
MTLVVPDPGIGNAQMGFFSLLAGSWITDLWSDAGGGAGVCGRNAGKLLKRQNV